MEQVTEVELDELATFIRRKEYQIWLWIVLCRHSRKVLAYYVGDRSNASAYHLWQSLPLGVRQEAYMYTDRWAAYLRIAPPGRHGCKGKVTNHVERFNNTLRQRVAPLVRKTLSFAKTKQGLTQRIVVFLNTYNATLS